MLYDHSRYLELVDTLYDSMVEDMNREGFTVSDKYKAKYDELGKTYKLRKSTLPLFSLRFISFLYLLFTLVCLILFGQS